MKNSFRYPIKVSVVIPVYNGEFHLAETIDSVLNQSFEDFELIIVDDYSTDSTQEIAQKYTRLDERVSYYRKERHLGMGGNWNHSILLARGEYIKLLCMDDIIEPEHLQTFIDVLSTHPMVSLVTSFEQFIGDLHIVRKMPDLPAIGELDGRPVQKHLMNFGNWIGSPSSVMFRQRDLYIGLFNYDWFWIIDLDMWIRLLAVGNLYVVPQILTHNRIHNRRVSTVGNKDYAFIKEELMFLRVALQFPKIYGSYTSSEQKSIYCHLLNRLIEEGLSKKDLQSLLIMTQIGQEFGRMRFLRLFIISFIRKCIHNRFTRKIKGVLSTLDKFSLPDLSWRRKFGYKRDPKTINVNWTIVYTHGVIQVPINILRVPIYTPSGIRLVSIEETPHYKWVKDIIAGIGDTYTRNKYREYVETFFPEENADHQLIKIVNLVSSFQSQSPDDSVISIVTHSPTHKQGVDHFVVIYDGVHRSSIAKALGHRFIQCRLITSRIKSQDFAPSIFEGQNILSK